MIVLKIILGIALILSANMLHEYFHLPTYIELPIIILVSWAYAFAFWVKHDEDDR